MDTDIAAMSRGHIAKITLIAMRTEYVMTAEYATGRADIIWIATATECVIITVPTRDVTEDINREQALFHGGLQRMDCGLFYFREEGGF